MTPLEGALLFAAIFMATREIIKLLQVVGRGSVRFRLGYWIHLTVTVSLVVACVAVFL